MAKDLKKAFLDKLNNSQGDKYTLLGDYTSSKNKTLFRHNICGYVWETTPGNILRLKKCPKCASNIKVTPEEFSKYVAEVTNGEYEVIGEYTGAHDRIKILHTVCGKYSIKAPTDFKSGRRCPYCVGEYNDTVFREKVLSLVGEEYSISEDYSGWNTPIKVKHNTCGITYKVAPNNFINGRRCWECRKKAQTKTTEWFKNKVFEACGDEYTVIGHYVKAKDYIEIRHNICNHTWEVTPDNFLRRASRCPICKYSKGEVFIESLLERINISYLREYKFDKCVYKNKLPFDFYLPDLNMCIEYDGAQHFRPVNFGGCDDDTAHKNYEVTSKRDAIKNKYCKDNSIHLVRVPYTLTKEEVEELLLKEINSRAVKQSNLNQN